MLRLSRYEGKRVNLEKTFERYSRILTKLGKLKYFFVIRNHKDLLMSYFNQFYKDLYALEFNYKNFVKILDFEQNKNKFLIDNFNFFKCFEILKKNSNETKIFLFEELLNDKQVFFLELSEYLNEDISFSDKLNKKQSREYVISNRSLGNFFKNKILKKRNFINKLNVYSLTKNLNNLIILLKYNLIYKNRDILNKNLIEKKSDKIKNYFKNDLNKFDSNFQKRLRKNNYY